MSSPISIERGKRFKLCRIIANKHLKDFAISGGMSYSNLSKYERGSLLIAEKNVDKFLALLMSKHILCSKEWLLYGEGEHPRNLNSPSIKEQNLFSVPDISNDFLIFNEIEFFKTNNIGAIIKCVEDTSMAPIFNVGDYVGGIPLHPTFFSHLNAQYCIIEFANEHQLIRKFFIDENVILLTPENPSLPALHITGKEFKVYPIIYHRKLLKI